MLKIIRLLPI